LSPRAIPFFSALIGGVAAAAAVLIAQPFANSTHRTVLQGTSATRAFAADVISGSALTPRAIYERDASGVVSIRASSAAPGERPLSRFGGQGPARTDTGTGIVLSNSGLILTNEHVVDGARSITVALDGQSGRTRTATLVGADRSRDLALLRIDPAGLALHPLTLADSAATQVGDGAYAIGNPFGLNWTLTTGVVSALSRQIQAPDGSTISHVIQTDAALNPGNSGGPLINASGGVIGINSQIVSKSSSAGGQGGSEGVGFAIPSNTVRSFVRQFTAQL